MASIQMHTARTTVTDPVASADDLLTQLGSVTPKLVTLFASADRDQGALNKALRERLPKETRLIGATTAGEIDNDGMHMGSAVLGALTGDFEVGLGLGTGLSMDAIGAGEMAVKAACNDLGIRPKDLNAQQYVGIVMDDSSKFKKEELLMGMMGQNQDMILVGGGANDDSTPDYAQKKPLVHVDGEVAGDGVMFALFHTDAPWAAMRSHWFQPTGESLTITKVDSSFTRALEIDGQPAAQRFSEMVGVPIDELEFGKPNGFATTSLGLQVGREYFMRTPWKPLEDGSILFTSLVEEDLELEIMQSGDMVASTTAFLKQALPQQVASPQAAYMFHCEGRTWVAANSGKLPDLAMSFQAAPPCVGLNVGFEIYCGFHINTTLTSLVFGAN